jgi:hypothetical protein
LGSISVPDFWRRWADYLSLVFEVNFRTFLPECSLQFLPRPLDEIAFEVLRDLRESTADRQFIARRNIDIHAPKKWKCFPAAVESGA